MKVLIADDSHIIRKIIRINLERQDIEEIFETSNGKETLHCIVNNPDLDLVFLDLNMPLINGLQIAQAVYMKKLLSHSKIIAISDNLSPKSRNRFESFGVNYFIGKPFNITEFNEVVVPLIESKHGFCQLPRVAEKEENIAMLDPLMWLTQQTNLQVTLDETNVYIGNNELKFQLNKELFASMIKKD